MLKNCVLLYLEMHAGLGQTPPPLYWMMWTAPPVSTWWFCSAPSVPPLTPTVLMDVMMPLSPAVSYIHNMSLYLLVIMLGGIKLWVLPGSTITVLCVDTTRLWSNPYNGMVRLTGGNYTSEGLVEVYCNGQWGTVCDNGFGSTDANTVCKQLGYSRAVRYDHLAMWVNLKPTINSGIIWCIITVPM